MNDLRSTDGEDAAIVGNGVGDTATNAEHLTRRAPKRRAEAEVEPEPGTEPNAECSDSRFTVAMVKKGAKDSRGKLIEDVFFKRDAYAIYQADREMAIQFAGDVKKASSQIKLVSPLLPMRNKIQFLCSRFQSFDCYRHQIAEALHLALEGQREEGRKLLRVVIADCAEQRKSFGRRCYMKSAIPTALIIFAFMLIFSVAAYAVPAIWGEETASPSLMLLATAGGAMGALLSIAIAIRGRAVELDGDPSANRLDARVRIVIGVISGAALYLILATGLFGVTFVKPTETGANIDWAMALLIGIAAGFVERAVPNLLEGNQPSDPGTPEPEGETQAA